MSPQIAQRLAEVEIQQVAEAREYVMFARENCVAMVRRTEAGFSGIGSTGAMTEHGLAYLVWEDGQPRLRGKGGQTEAAPEQIETMQRFSADLKRILEL